MKRFPLEPLRRVRDLRLDGARRILAVRRAEMEEALRRRDVAKEAWTEAVEWRARHQRECARAATETETIAVIWLGRADRHRSLIDAEIAKTAGLLRGKEEELERTRQAFGEAFAVVRRAQSKVDALDNFRDGWRRKQQHDKDRRDEDAGEELYLAASMKR
jgi:hypothetical protein